MPQDKLTLEIATPERLLVTEDVDEVVLPSADGSLGVLPGHAPLLAKLDIGEVSFRIGTERKYFALSSGFAEVLRDAVEILAETCEPAEDIDADRAERSKERAEARLKAAEDETDFARASGALRRALTRIQIHGRLG
jgi:F-type H+-transporting ATPase subunit epsilon